MFIPGLMRMSFVLYRWVHANYCIVSIKDFLKMLSISSNGHKTKNTMTLVFQQLHIMARISSHVINHIAIFSIVTVLLLGILVAAILKTGSHFGFNVLTYDLFMTKDPMRGFKTALLLDGHMIFGNTNICHSVVATRGWPSWKLVGHLEKKWPPPLILSSLHFVLLSDTARGQLQVFVFKRPINLLWHKILLFIGGHLGKMTANLKRMADILNF